MGNSVYSYSGTMQENDYKDLNINVEDYERIICSQIKETERNIDNQLSNYSISLRENLTRAENECSRDLKRISIIRNDFEKGLIAVSDSGDVSVDEQSLKLSITRANETVGLLNGQDINVSSISDSFIETPYDFRNNEPLFPLIYFEDLHDENQYRLAVETLNDVKVFWQALAVRDAQLVHRQKNDSVYRQLSNVTDGMNFTLDVLEDTITHLETHSEKLKTWGENIESTEGAKYELATLKLQELQKYVAIYKEVAVSVDDAYKAVINILTNTIIDIDIDR